MEFKKSIILLHISVFLFNRRLSSKALNRLKELHVGNRSMALMIECVLIHIGGYVARGVCLFACIMSVSWLENLTQRYGENV